MSSEAAPVNSTVKQLRAENEGLARRRMRKGTRSCLQCRSRKVRCIYPPNSRICHGCLTHGRDCTEQTYQDVKNGGLDKRVGLKERVRELEGLVQQLVETGGADAREIEQRLRRSKESEGSLLGGGFLSPPDSSSGKDASPIEGAVDYGPDEGSESYEEYDDDVDHPGNETGDFRNAPLMSLLNNSILQSTKETTIPIRTAPTKPASSAKAARQAKVVEDLRAMALPIENIRAMIAKVKDILAVFQELMFQTKAMGFEDLEQAMVDLISSDRPIHILKALCFLTGLVQQTDPDVFNSDPCILGGLSQVDFIHKYSDLIEMHLCGANSMIGSLDGLECAVMLGKIQFNDGRPRKSWLLNQRSLSYCRLLGFYRSSSWKTSPDASIGLRRHQVWWHLFMGDRAGSMLLGLPYSTSSNHIDMEMAAQPTTTGIAGRKYDMAVPMMMVWLQIAQVSGRVTDRNQSRATDASSHYAETMKIDGELHALQLLMPKKWWSLSEDADDISEYMEMPIDEILESSMVQTWCHECRIALHMPFMMKNAQEGQSGGQYEYSRKMATNSARALIRCQLRIRSRPDLSSLVCQVVDFQVFNSTVLLVLDLLARSRGKGKDFWEQKDEETRLDLVLIKDAYWMLRNISQRSVARANIPAQAVKVLETLGYLVRGCAVPGMDKHDRRIVIPYFGAITIKPSKSLQEQVASMPADPECEVTGMAESPKELRQKQRQQWQQQQIQLQQQQRQSVGLTTPTSVESSLHLSPASDYQPINDLTFNAFSAPQVPVSFVPPSSNESAVGLDSMLPGSGLPYNGGPDVLGDSYVPTEGLDINMWDDNEWQQMLLDPSLDLDTANWGFFPVEGTV